MDKNMPPVPSHIPSDNNVKKYLLLLLLILLPIIGYAIGRYTHQQLPSSQNIDVVSQEAELQKLNDKLELCYLDRALVLNEIPETSIYDFGEFNIYSPLFEGKEIRKTRFQYKDAIITQKEIVSDAPFEGHDWSVTVWELSQPSRYFEGFPTFDGYENYTHTPVWVNEEKRNNESESYTNPEGIVMTERARANNAGTYLSGYEFSSAYTPSGNNIFVTVHVLTNNPFEHDGISVQQAGQVAKQIADSISLRTK